MWEMRNSPGLKTPHKSPFSRNWSCLGFVFRGLCPGNGIFSRVECVRGKFFQYYCVHGGLSVRGLYPGDFLLEDCVRWNSVQWDCVRRAFIQGGCVRGEFLSKWIVFWGFCSGGFPYIQVVHVHQGCVKTRQPGASYFAAKCRLPPVVNKAITPITSIFISLYSTDVRGMHGWLIWGSRIQAMCVLLAFLHKMSICLSKQTFRRALISQTSTFNLLFANP